MIFLGKWPRVKYVSNRNVKKIEGMFKIILLPFQNDVFLPIQSVFGKLKFC